MPETFGFSAGPAFNPAYLAAMLAEMKFIPYDEHYFTLPGLDTGAYLTVLCGGRAPNTNEKFQFEIPKDWPPGDYVATVRCAAAAAVPEECRFLEFSVFPGTGGSPPLSVHQVADTPPGIRALEGIPLVASDKPVAPEHLRSGLDRFCVEAYRGSTPAAGEIDRLVAIYSGRRALGGSHIEALKETLAAVLSSPRFLYKAEPGPQETRRVLDGLELATWLSYFLWGSPPDAELRRLAAGGELLQPNILQAQTDRLLDDPRSSGLVEPFLSQWLAMDRLDFFQFDPALYPKFDQATKLSARREVYEAFAHLLHSNGPVSDLLAADYVVVNALLAQYYGLDGVVGDAFRRVSLPPDSPRGGLIGMAAIHAMGSNGEHSSPVERGAWVLRKLLNDPPPPAPPNVPQLARLAGKPLTTRERVSIHQEGVTEDEWYPKIGEPGANYTLPPLLEPLARHKADFTIVQGLWNRYTGNGHYGSTFWLTGANEHGEPGQSFYNSVSVDQVAAKVLGTETRFESLAFDCGDAANGSGHGPGLSLSWDQRGKPVGGPRTPVEAFHRLFAKDTTPLAQQQAMLAHRRSVLDNALENARDLARSLGRVDADKLDEYLDGIRDRAQSELLAGLFDRLKATTEPDGSSLFDNVTVVYGSNIRTAHSLDNCPTLLAGRGAGIRLGENLVVPKGTPLSNAWLTLLRGSGVATETFGDATGVIPDLNA